MAFYRIGKATGAATTGSAAATVQGGTTVAAEVLAYGYFLNAATASSIEAARPANTPAATSPTLLNAINPDQAPAAIASLGTAWGTAPTTPTVLFDLITLPATIGAGYFFGPVPVGAGIALSKVAGSTAWLVFWNFGAGTASVLNLSVMDNE